MINLFKQLDWEISFALCEKMNFPASYLEGICSNEMVGEGEIARSQNITMKVAGTFQISRREQQYDCVIDEEYYNLNV